MRIYLTVLMALVLFSCAGEASQREAQLKTKVTLLEQRVDSLIWALQVKDFPPELSPPTSEKKRLGTKKSTAAAASTTAPSGYASYSAPVRRSGSAAYSGRCGAITRRGSQCSRSSRSGGYCWQHGG